jgi:hypothetical protein
MIKRSIIHLRPYVSSAIGNNKDELFTLHSTLQSIQLLALHSLACHSTVQA